MPDTKNMEKSRLRLLLEFAAQVITRRMLKINEVNNESRTIKGLIITMRVLIVALFRVSINLDSLN